MNVSFSTEKHNEYNIDNCEDIGCIVLSCIRFDETKIPTLKKF